MKKRFFRNRRSRYIGISTVLTVLVVVTVVLINSLFGSLATRYEWNVPMNAEANYDVTNVCYTLLDSTFAAATAENTAKRTSNVRILFCDTEEVWREDAVQSYLYHTAKSLDARYDRVVLEFYDLFLNPDHFRDYTTDPQTGEAIDLNTTDIIVVCDDYYRVYQLKEFFVFADAKRENVQGYVGERTLAAAIISAVNRTQETACLTGNHGEVFYDYELVYLLDAAGYDVVTNFDLADEDIPAACTLLITYNPNSDLDDSQGIEESKKLDSFLAKDGNGYLVFLSNGTPTLGAMERYLKAWGVETSYHTDHATGKTYRHTVQDTSQSLTSDGYTIYGELSDSASVQERFKNTESTTVFKNATALKHAGDYAAGGNGTYTKGARTLHSVYDATRGAVLWANGVASDGSDIMLMTLTEQKNATGGSSFVSVIASADFAVRDQLQSAVYENPDVLQRLFSIMGQTDTTEGLRVKPFATSEISTITTAQMLRWTICLSVIPAGVIAILGIVILVRRRRA
ncbi:MAG: hypothetical protein IJW16_05495 [Clostridia bacterium]|nr:hypothetical protein [Clostridia bacterium]